VSRIAEAPRHAPTSGGQNCFMCLRIPGTTLAEDQSLLLQLCELALRTATAELAVDELAQQPALRKAQQA
jgi:hypothetical protein